MSQQNKTTLQSAINTQLADNTSGDISAADVRDNMINMTDSLVFNNGSSVITGSLGITGSLTQQNGDIAFGVADTFGTRNINVFFNGSNEYITLGAGNSSSKPNRLQLYSQTGVAQLIAANDILLSSPTVTVSSSMLVEKGITGSLQGTATTASFASTASYIPVAQTLVDANLPLVLINGNSLVKDQYDSITYNPLNNLLTVGANTDFTGPITSLSSISSTGGFTGSLQGTSSYANQALSASWAPSTGGSSFPYTGSAGISGSLVLDGTLRQGQSTQTTGNYSRAYGNSSIASGDYSHAEGNSTEAIGQSSHAEGQFTLTMGTAAHSEGVGTVALGNFSHAEGTFTVASGSSQHVQGKYNTHGDTTSLMIVGNGTDDTDRKDAFKVRMSGSIVLPTTQSAAPSWTGTDGEMVFATVTGNHYFYVWMGGAWRSGSLS
jgi:hypothetical protein